MIVMNHRRAVLTALALLATLAACSGSSAPAGNSNSAAAGKTSLQDDALPARSALPLSAGCGWSTDSNIDTTNVAFPDNAAKYWVALLPMTPGTRVRIDGRYPVARYFSFNSYDPLLRALDVQTDLNIAPLRADNNPLQNPSALPGARYTIYLNDGAAPTPRAANTLYAGDIAAGPVVLPNALVPVIYRIYVPGQGYDFDGGVGLPQLTIETADGKTELAQLPTCAVPPLPTLGGLLPGSGLNALLLGADYPDTLALPFPTAVYPPRTNRFYGLPDSTFAILGNVLPLPVQETGGKLPLGDGGFLSNKDNAYVTTGFSRKYGNLIVMRARAPSYRGAPGVALGSENLRYWSICENEFLTQRYVACSADHETALDRDGYFTIAVSDLADRPANATPAQQISWLPWGPFVDGLLIYRNMLPSPSFRSAIQNVAKGTPPATVMGDYFPQVSYCRREIFEHAGNDAAAIFAACAADQQAHPAG
jgi:hypothetical protein